MFKKENIAAIKIEHILTFNQLNLDDIMSFGNCYAYSVLFFSYVTLFKLFESDKDVDYSKLLDVLNNFDKKKKRDLNNIQEVYRENNNYHKILDFEIALLNTNSSDNFCYDYVIYDLCREFYYNTQQFKSPRFYFLHIRDNTQKILGNPLSHAVCFYHAKKDEIHFFDSNSGLFILKLNNECNISIDYFHDIFIDLIFNKNLIFKVFFDSKAETINYELNKSIPNVKLKGFQKNILNFLKSYIHNPDLFLKEIDYKDFNDNDRIKNYLERNIFILKYLIPLLPKTKEFKKEKSVEKKETNSLQQSRPSFFKKLTEIEQFKVVTNANGDLTCTELKNPLTL